VAIGVPVEFRRLVQGSDPLKVEEQNPTTTNARVFLDAVVGVLR